jgi:hypothetical protein
MDVDLPTAGHGVAQLARKKITAPATVFGPGFLFGVFVRGRPRTKKVNLNKCWLKKNSAPRASPPRTEAPGPCLTTDMASHAHKIYPGLFLIFCSLFANTEQVSTELALTKNMAANGGNGGGANQTRLVERWKAGEVIGDPALVQMFIERVLQVGRALFVYVYHN